MTRPQPRPALAMIALASACVSLAACSSSSSSSAAPASAPAAAATSPAVTPSAATSPATSSPTAAASGPSTGSSTGAAAIGTIALGDADVRNGATFKLFGSGDKVKGQVTLDNCGYRFTSEQNRVARHQAGLTQAGGARTGLSNEVVAYDTTAHAAQALAQWRASVARCKAGTEVKPPEAGAPLVRYGGEKVRTEPRLPVAANAVTTALATVKSTGKKVYLLAVMQQKGPILDIVWLNAPSAPPAAEVDAVLGLALTTGKRLAAS